MPPRCASWATSRPRPIWPCSSAMWISASSSISTRWTFLNFVVGLHAALGVEIAEADYPKFATLDGGVDYLTARVAAGVRR